MAASVSPFGKGKAGLLLIKGIPLLKSGSTGGVGIGEREGLPIGAGPVEAVEDLLGDLAGEPASRGIFSLLLSGAGAYDGDSFGAAP